MAGKQATTRPRRKPGKPAGPTRLNASVRSLIVEGIAKGMTVVHACAIAGVSKSSYYRWKEAGEADIEDGKLTTQAAKLHHALEEAEARYREHGLAVITDFAEGYQTEETQTVLVEQVVDGQVVGPAERRTTIHRKSVRSWQAQAWLLERRFPADFGRRIEAGDSDGAGAGEKIIMIGDMDELHGDEV